jgi:hypothetical protein
MTSAVVLGLSLATLVLLLGAFLATTRQDRKPRSDAARTEPDSKNAEFPMSAPVVGGQVGIDYVDPRTIKVGDKIDCQGVRAEVLGAIHATAKGQQWTEYLLDDGTRRYQWLSVEVRSGLTEGDPPHLEVLLWTAVPTQGMVPAKSMLILDGVEFHPIGRGTAAFKSEGTTGMPERGLLDFADYQASDGRLLSFERVQGESWIASYAQPLPPGSIQIHRRAT